MPRTYSVDSVDYTTMLMGDVEEEVKAEAKKKRRERKPKKLQESMENMTSSDYSKIMNKNNGMKEEEMRRKGKNVSK